MFDELFNSTQVIDFAGNNKGSSFTALTGTACAAYSVYIAFRILRQIIVVYVSYTANVESAGCDVRSDEYINCFFTELANDGISLSLCQVAVNTFCRITAFFQAFRQFVDAAFRANENNSQVRFLQVQQSAENIELLAVGNFNVRLFHQVDGYFFSFHANNLRVFQKGFGQLLNGCRHSCGEEKGLSRFRGSRHD